MGEERLTWHSVEAEIVSADIPGILSLCSAKGLSISKIRQQDFLTVSVLVSEKDYTELKSICHKRGASIKVKKGRGIFLYIQSLIKRPALLTVIGILLFFSLWLPERVLFVQVEGNSTVSALEILNAAQGCGIRFGASRVDVRSEAIKNALLDEMPALQWAGVNTKGCTAIISVRERETDTPQPLPGTVSSLVAVRDGIVLSGTATAGNLQCSPGQVVQVGDVLVSGYTDCGISVRVQKAKGEVFALTVRPLTVLSPVKYVQKGSAEKEIKKYSLIIGKKRINLSKDSGISYTSCDKIRKEYVLTLPGGFLLPVSVVVDTYSLWDTRAVHTDGIANGILSGNAARRYLMENMIAGEILDMVLSEFSDETLYRLEGNYLCSEMIARERNEEIMEEYGKNRGEDR